jgi:hypothetical protein
LVGDFPRDADQKRMLERKFKRIDEHKARHPGVRLGVSTRGRDPTGSIGERLANIRLILSHKLIQPHATQLQKSAVARHHARHLPLGSIDFLAKNEISPPR